MRVNREAPGIKHGIFLPSCGILGVIGLASIFLALVIGSILSTPRSYAYSDDYKDLEVNFIVDSVISIKTLNSSGTSQIDNINLDITPTAAGVFAKNNFTIQVDTNNVTGYSLMMSSDYKTDGTTSETTPPSEATYTNALVNAQSGSATIPSVGETVAESDFSAANSAYQNMWGVSRSWNETVAGETHTGGDISSYSTVPVHGSTVTLRNDVEDQVKSSRTNIGVAMNINAEKLSGNYRNKLVFTAVGTPAMANCTPNKICYMPNGDSVSGFMDDQDTVLRDDSNDYYDELSFRATGFTLNAPNFIRPGYGFAGWNTKADGTGAMFGPNQTLISPESYAAVDQGGESVATFTPELQNMMRKGGLVLYAQWIPSAGDMQNWNGCNAMNIGDVTALTDNRVDSINIGKTYAVAKLADGKCWMIENLRYAGAGENSSSWSYTTDGTTNTIQQYNYSNLTPDPTNYSNDGDDNRYSYGVYYSWAAAIDDTDTHDDAGIVSAPGICPTGWRVPINFSSLQNALSGSVNESTGLTTSNAWRSYPNNFVISGEWYKTHLSDAGGYGTYWSSVVNQNGRVHVAMIGFMSISLYSYRNKSDGYPVRCVMGEDDSEYEDFLEASAVGHNSGGGGVPIFH